MWVCDVHLEVNPAETSLLYSEVWGNLQEARSVTFLLDSRSLISPLICPQVVLPPGRKGEMEGERAREREDYSFITAVMIESMTEFSSTILEKYAHKHISLSSVSGW